MQRVRTRDGRDRRPPCATTTSTARGCRATRPTPASRASSAPRWPPASRRACSRTAPSGETSSTCATSPEPTCRRSRRRDAGRVQRRQRHAAQRGGDGRGAGARRRRRAGPGRDRRVARRRRPPRLRLARARGDDLGFRAVEDFDAGMREFAEARAACHDAVRRRRPRRVDRVRALHARPGAGRDHRRHGVVLRGRRAAPRSSPSSSPSSPATSTSSPRSAPTSAAGARRSG